MRLEFLRNDPPAEGVNIIKFFKLDNTPIVAFHPFITSFTHTIQPKVEVSTYGAFQIPSYNRTGLATEEYSIGIDLPAVNLDHAKKNYKAVQKIQALVKPTLSEAQNQSGIIKMSVNPLIEGEVIGFLTKVDATYEIEPGFEEGYSKLIRLSISFGVDKAYAELISQPASTNNNIVAQTDQEAALAVGYNIGALTQASTNTMTLAYAPSRTGAAGAPTTTSDSTRVPPGSVGGTTAEGRVAILPPWEQKRRGN